MRFMQLSRPLARISVSYYLLCTTLTHPLALRLLGITHVSLQHGRCPGRISVQATGGDKLALRIKQYMVTLHRSKRSMVEVMVNEVKWVLRGQKCARKARARDFRDFMP